MSSEAHQDTRYGVARPCVTRQFGEETIAVPLSRDAADMSCVFVMNEVAAQVYRMLQGGGTTVDDAVAALVGEFEVTPTQATEDVRALLDDLVEAGLVSIVPA